MTLENSDIFYSSYGIRADSLHTLLKKQLRRASACGFSIVKDGHIYYDILGNLHADAEAGCCDIHTKFQTASITKIFTGYLVEKLVAEKRLRYDMTLKEISPKPVCEKLGIDDDTTINMLLSHQSGLMNPKISFYSDSYRAEITEFAQSAIPQVLYIPETKGYFYYSDAGYNLLGYLCQVVTNKPFEQLINDYIIEPLHLYDTGFAGQIPQTNCCSGTEFMHGRICNLPAQVDNPSYFPSDLIYSSIADLSRFVAHILEHFHELRRLFEPQVECISRSYFCRTWVSERYRKKNIYYHHGADCGALGRIYLVPSENIGIILLCNGESIGHAERIIHYCLYKIDLNSGEDKICRQLPEPSYREDSQLSAKYLSTDGKLKKIEFFMEQGKILVKATINDVSRMGELDKVHGKIHFTDERVETIRFIFGENKRQVKFISYEGALYEGIGNEDMVESNSALFHQNVGVYCGVRGNESKEKHVRLYAQDGNKFFAEFDDVTLEIFPHPCIENFYISSLGRLTFLQKDKKVWGFAIRDLLIFRKLIS